MNVYEGRHRDNSAAADARCRYLDHEARWNRLYPCTHHHARHSAFALKVRLSDAHREVTR